MSRPRFLANHDLTEAIVLGLARREPAIQFHRLRELGLANRPDTEVLEFAAREGFLLVSHDVNTMTAHASQRIASGLLMPASKWPAPWLTWPRQIFSITSRCRLPIHLPPIRNRIWKSRST